MAAGATIRLNPRPSTPVYAELHCHSDHSLLDGVCAPESLVEQAAATGMPALALTDHNALYGAVRFVLAAREAGIKPILGAEMTLEGGAHLTLLVETPKGYGNLCRLITLARQGQEKGAACLAKHHLANHVEGLIALSGCQRGEVPQLLAAKQFEQATEVARGYARLFGADNFLVELQRHHLKGDNRLLAQLVVLATRVGLDFVATGNAHYLNPAQREVHDVLRCIHHRSTLEDAGDLLRPNDEFHLRSPGEMATLFADARLALENSLRIVERCASAVDYLPWGPQTLPRYPVPGGRSADKNPAPASPPLRGVG
jgi:error-prone DNA polymerase